MVVQVTTKKLGELIVRLEKRIPHSLQAFYLARAVKDQRWRNVSFYVDKWPEFSVVVSKPSDGHESFCKYTSSEHGIFCTDNSALKKMLRSNDLLDWNADMKFYGVSMTQRVHEELQKAAEEVGGSLDIEDSGHMFVVNPVVHDISSQTPSNMYFSALTNDDSRMIQKDWAIDSQPECEEFLHHLLSKFPSCALMHNPGGDQQHEIVGYAMMHHMGALGMAHIRKSFPGVHMLTLISSYLVKRCYATGFSPYPYGFIPHENVATSTQGFGLDYRLVSGSDVAWCRYKPRMQIVNRCDSQIF